VSYDYTAVFSSLCRSLLENPLTSLDELAGSLGVSPRTIQTIVVKQGHRDFRSLRGELFQRKLREILSSQPALTIEELSAGLGYKSARSFARAVKRSCGKAPIQLRALKSIDGYSLPDFERTSLGAVAHDRGEFRQKHEMDGSKVPTILEEDPVQLGPKFYWRVHDLLEREKFDAFVERSCRELSRENIQQQPLQISRYFRFLLIWYFEGTSEVQTIVTRVADSISMRGFLDVGMTEQTPDHTTILEIRRALGMQIHHEVFTWVISILANEDFPPRSCDAVDRIMQSNGLALRHGADATLLRSYEAFLVELAEN
jgi:AraC-like DNA-binding protein